MDKYLENYLEHHGIKGQKWKVRRFQNKDGSLTPAGKQRYRNMSDEDLAKATEKLKTKAKRVAAEQEAISLASVDTNAKYYERARAHATREREVKRMKTLKEYNNLRKELYPEEPSKLEKASDALDKSSKLVGQIQDINRRHTEKHTTKERFDLSEMSDQDLRNAIERHRLEEQYHQAYARDIVTVSKGRERLNKIVDGAAGAIAVGTSVVSLALMIKQLRG